MGRLACMVAFALALLASGPAASQGRRSLPVLDELEIVRLERDVLALGARGGDARFRLELGEFILSESARGITAAVVTNRRLMVVRSGAGVWQEIRLLQVERPETQVLVDERVAVAFTPRRVIGFSGETGSVAEYRIGPNETLMTVRAAEGIVVALTDRNALGFSARRGGFFATSLQLRERIETVDLRAELATVRTDRRLLVFRGLGGVWGDRRRELGG